MKNKKRETFIYEGLGFPVLLVNVPMRKVLGEWAIDINFDQLQIEALRMLAKKQTRLTGKEIRFIRHYMDMSTHEFAKELEVTHVSILKWESEKTHMNPNTEIVLRLRILKHLNVPAADFKKTFHFITSQALSSSVADSTPFEIDAEKIAC